MPSGAQGPQASRAFYVATKVKRWIVTKNNFKKEQPRRRRVLPQKAVEEANDVERAGELQAVSGNSSTTLIRRDNLLSVPTRGRPQDPSFAIRRSCRKPKVSAQSNVRPQSDTRLGYEQLTPGSRLIRPFSPSSPLTYAFNTAPLGRMSWSTQRHSAIRSFRARATIPIFRSLLLPPPNRRSNHRVRALLGWCRTQHQAISTRSPRMVLLPALSMPCSRPDPPLS